MKFVKKVLLWKKTIFKSRYTFLDKMFDLMNHIVHINPTNGGENSATTIQAVSNAHTNNSRIRQVPKKRLYMDRNSTGSTEYEHDSGGSVRSPDGSSNHGDNGSCTSGSSFQLPNSTTECGDQPENLSLKRIDRVPSQNGSTSLTCLYQVKREEDSNTVTPKVKDSIDMKKFWEERLANGLYAGGLCDSASSPSKNNHQDNNKMTASAALLAATATAAENEVPSTNNYLASFNLIAEAELAALYSAAQASGHGGPTSSNTSSPTKNSSKTSADPGSNNPISIRSFCVQEGNTYRCKVCNNAYTHPSNFHRHYVTTHLNRKSYPCTVCDKKFNRKDNMTAHLRTVHGWGGGAGGGANVNTPPPPSPVPSSPAGVQQKQIWGTPNPVSEQTPMEIATTSIAPHSPDESPAPSAPVGPPSPPSQISPHPTAVN